MKILGVMTGTSCDGLDAACTDFNEIGWKPLWAKSRPYPRALRERVLAAQIPGAKLSLREWGELHRDLGIWMARVLANILRNVPRARRPEAIACHGQTVAHFPAAQRLGFTMQLGDSCRIAEATGLTVISNFRGGDMAAGGEGAPLAPRFHKLLAAGRGGIAIHNLGGISNLTYIGLRDEIIAFDTGPGNSWIDAAAELVSGGKVRFDRNGKIAREHSADLRAVETILRGEYFRRSPPKSTGREDFPFERLLRATRVCDGRLVATATAITVESIVRAYADFILKKKLPLKAIYFCGGGARNSFLIESLRARLGRIHVASVNEIGVDARYLEANAFGYFGSLALKGRAIGGSWTGVDGWAPPAQIIPGRNWTEIVRQIGGAARV